MVEKYYTDHEGLLGQIASKDHKLYNGASHLRLETIIPPFERAGGQVEIKDDVLNVKFGDKVDFDIPLFTPNPQKPDRRAVFLDAANFPNAEIHQAARYASPPHATLPAYPWFERQPEPPPREPVPDILFTASERARGLYL